MPGVSLQLGEEESTDCMWRYAKRKQITSHLHVQAILKNALGA